MNPTPIPVALRAYTIRRTVEQLAADPAPQKARRRKTASLWPARVLTFDTETTSDAVQRLIFGGYRASRWASARSLELVQEGLFHADDLAAWNPAAMRELREYADANAIRLISRREFMERVFRPLAIDAEALVVGFNLPFDISRIAIDAGEARAPNYGGFSFTLWDYEATPGEWKEHPFRPRIAVKSLDSKRAFIRFTRPYGEKGTKRTFQGHFLDLRTLAFALSGKSYSLASACQAFGVEHGKLTTETHGVVTRDYIAYNRRDVLATEELLVRLREEFDAYGLPFPATSAYSPASIAKGYLRAMGVRPLAMKTPTISPVDLGRAMTAFYGGRAEARIRRVPLPVRTVDFRSMYPTVNTLFGLWQLLTSESVRMVECTEELRAMLANASVEAALRPETWPQLRAFVELAPQADLLPVRGKYSDTRDGLNIGLNYFTSETPFVYAAPDVYASALLTGKVPPILRAWRLEGESRQEGLHPIRLGGKIAIDPATDDFFRRVIEERVRIKSSGEYSDTERARLSQLLKLIANSGAYGIFAEMNREELPTEERTPISVYGTGDPVEQSTNTPEDLGAFCFPPVASLIASGARLMLAILERLVSDEGGTYAFCDTDALAIISTKNGGLIECEGGTADLSDRLPAVRALSYDAIDRIIYRINTLNPYDRDVIPSILNIEEINYEDGTPLELWSYVISAKRYALFTWNSDRTVRLRKVSEHGLGHLLNPIPRIGGENWPDALWDLILSEELGIPRERVKWLTYPAVTRLSISSPGYFRGFLRREKDRPYQERLKPYGFLVSAQVARASHPEGVDPKRFHLIAPFSAQPSEWSSALQTDTYSGRQFAISTALSFQKGIIRVRSIADVKAEFLAHGEAKSAASTREPAERDVCGVLSRRHVTPSEIRLIGKESNALELVDGAAIHDWDSILSTYRGRGQPRSEILESGTAAAIARAFGVSVRTVRSWRRKTRRA